MEQIIGLLDRNNIFRRFSLRVHKFTFQWDLVIHLFVCIASLCPFFFTGNRVFSLIPLTIWAFYHVLFLLGPNQANLVIPGFGKFKHSFKSTLEDFFSPKLLPVLSISFLLVALSLGVTGHRLGGPPLCYHPCGVCLALWDESIPLDSTAAGDYERYRHGCGYANGKELLGYYTMAQTSFLLFCTVVVAMAVCLAWRVAEEEHEERNQAEQWLKAESPSAYALRAEVIAIFGAAGSSIRPEGSLVWVFFGIIAAITFTLLGWHNWYVLPPSHLATLLIILNLLTIITTILILHLGFFGRLLALYRRNFQRVAFFTAVLERVGEGDIVGKWWNCRNFVLNDDLSLDYDIGGLAVSLTFLINLSVFVILLLQLLREGSSAVLEAPASYCAYACLYITTCLIKIFTLATNTYEEQHKHITELQKLQPKGYDLEECAALLAPAPASSALGGLGGGLGGPPSPMASMLGTGPAGAITVNQSSLRWSHDDSADDGLFIDAPTPSSPRRKKAAYFEGDIENELPPSPLSPHSPKSKPKGLVMDKVKEKVDKPTLGRSMSYSSENNRQAIIEIISQIR